MRFGNLPGDRPCSARVARSVWRKRPVVGSTRTPRRFYDVCHVDWEIAPIAPWIVKVDEFAAPDVGLDRTPQRFLKAGQELVS